MATRGWIAVGQSQRLFKKDSLFQKAQLISLEIIALAVRPKGNAAHYMPLSFC